MLQVCFISIVLRLYNPTLTRAASIDGGIVLPSHTVTTQFNNNVCILASLHHTGWLVETIGGGMVEQRRVTLRRQYNNKNKISNQTRICVLTSVEWDC